MSASKLTDLEFADRIRDRARLIANDIAKLTERGWSVEMPSDWAWIDGSIEIQFRKERKL